jgi:hypothetical protein
MLEIRSTASKMAGAFSTASLALRIRPASGCFATVLLRSVAGELVDVDGG